MAFELKDGQLTFTHTDAEAIREKYRMDVTTQDYVISATQGDQKWASAILNGPSDDQVSALKAKAEADPSVTLAFDKVYGQGAAEFYMNDYNFWDNVKEIPGAIVGGAQEAVGNVYAFGWDMGSEWVADRAYDPLQAAIQKRANSETGGISDRNAATTALRNDPSVISDEEIDAEIANYAASVGEQSRSWTEERRQEELQRLADYMRDLQGSAYASYESPERTRQVRTTRAAIRAITEAVPLTEDEKRDLRRTQGTENLLRVIPGIGGTVDSLEPEDRAAVLDVVKKDLEKTLTGNITAGVSQFLYGFAGPSSALGALSTAAKAGKAGSAVAAFTAGVMADFTAFDPDSPQVVDLLQNNLGVEVTGTFLEYLKKEEGDSDAEKRFKAALEGAGLGLAVEALLFAVARGVRRGRGPQAEASSTGSSTQTQVNPVVEEVAKLKVVTRARGLTAKELSAVAKRLRGFDPEAPPVAPPKATDPTLPADTLVRPGATAGRALEKVAPKAPGVRKATAQVKAASSAATDTATRVWDDVLRSVDADAKAVWEKNPTIYGEYRTFEEMRAAAAVPARAVVELARRGSPQKLVEYALKPVSLAEVKTRSFAFQSASAALRRGVDELAQRFGDVVNDIRTTEEAREAILKEFNDRVRIWTTVENISTNMGSFEGALLGQRNATGASRARATPATAEELTAAGKPAPKGKTVTPQTAEQEALAQAADSMKKGMDAPSAFWKRYEELVTLRPDKAVDIFKWLREEWEEAAREGLKFGEKPKAPVEDVRTRADKIVDGINEYTYSAMLSGTRTFETNIISGILNVLMRTSYEGVFGLLSRNPQMRTMAAARLAGMAAATPTALRSAIKAFKEGRSLLSETHSFVEEGRSVLAGSVPGGKLITLPLKIMAFQDQFLKALWYRGEVQAKAAVEADILGLEGEARKNFIAGQLARAMDEHGRALDLTALAHAEEIPFQKRFNEESPYAVERGIATVVNAVSNAKNPWARLAGSQLFPFARIMFRLMDQGVRLTPLVREVFGLGMAVGSKLGGAKRVRSTKFFDDLMGVNGEMQRVRAYGEYAAGMAFMAFAYSWASSGMMTGGEPLDYFDADLKRQTVPPYHIKIGDKWYDYGRWEPFSFPLKITANFVNGADRIAEQRDALEFEKITQENQAWLELGGYMVGEAFTNNSFTDSLDNLMALISSEDTDAAREQLVKGQLEKFIPNLFKKINESLEGDLSYTSKDLMANLKRHFTFISDDNFGLDTRRNPFTGEPVVRKNPGASWTNFSGLPQEKLSDPVFEMLLEANESTGKQFTLKRPTAFTGIKPGTDLRKERADDGKRSLYDFYLNAVATVRGPGGKTYREALEELATNTAYRADPWGNRTRVRDNDKVKAILDVKETYEGLALAELRKQKAFRKLEVEQSSAEYFWTPRP